MQRKDDQVPVTLLTGFLGAGKTTLLNHLIRDPAAGRIAVIMNEFGDVGLDHDLIEEATEDTILMQSGCLCCSIRGELARTMAALMARQKRGELAFDRVVIETTGIADPGPIIQIMIADNTVAQNYRLDGVVTLADAANGPSTLDRQYEAVNQIAMADLVIITKADLVTPAALARFETRVADINPTAARLHATQGRVSAGALFNLTALRPEASLAEMAGWLGAVAPAPDPLAGLSGLIPPQSAKSRYTPASSAHDSRIVTASITVEAPIPADVFDGWLNQLVVLRGPDLLRIKGIVHVEDVEAPFVLHGVQHIFDAPVPMRTWPRDDKTSRIVVIARDFEQAELQAGLETLRARSSAEVLPTDDMFEPVTQAQQ